MADFWEKYVLLQHLLSQKFSKPSLFFIQPTQYLENSKLLSEWEKVHAYVADEKERRVNRQGYLLLLERMRRIKKSGVKIFDFTKVFSLNSETLFSDNCCHFNDKGYRLLAEALMKKIEAELLEKVCL